MTSAIEDIEGDAVWRMAFRSAQTNDAKDDFGDWDLISKNREMDVKQAAHVDMAMGIGI